MQFAEYAYSERKCTMKINKTTQQSKMKSCFTTIRKKYQLLLFLIPGLLAMIIFSYIPMGGILIAFKNYKIRDGILGSEWIGLYNFYKMFTGLEFPRVLKNTIVISLLKLAAGFPAPIILALLINEIHNSKFKKCVQTISYLPYFFSWVILGSIFTMFFSAEGPVNAILKACGMKESIIFFRSEGWFIFLLVVTHVYQSVGWGTVIYLAAISGIDASVIEAAKVDGAGRFKQVIHVILPTMLPTITTVLILNLGSVLNAGFDQIYNLYNPTLYEVADVLDTYVLKQLQDMNYSFGTAVGLFKSIVGVIFVLGSNWIVSKLSDDEMGIM